MDGVLNVHKLSGPTSHDVVARVRRIAGMKRVGHTGTLDPLASGVLVVCLGNATRVIEYMSGWQKLYSAEAVLGVETDSEDSTGEILSKRDASGITIGDVESVIPRFTGKIMQVPPMVSAVKHQGMRLYELARAGKTVERTAREIEVYSLRLTHFEAGEEARFGVEVTCSGGTYIRTLCADIGMALGCGAHMSALTRTAVGGFRIEDALTTETLEQMVAEGRLDEALVPMSRLLGDMPSLMAAPREELLVTNGVVLALERFTPGVGTPTEGHPVRICAEGDRLTAIGLLRHDVNGCLEVKPEKVFAPVGKDEET